MKKLIYLIILPFLISYYSCDNSGECLEFSDSGQSSANSSYLKYESNAVFKTVLNEGSIELNLSLTKIDEYCFLDEAMYFNNLPFKIDEKINLEKSPNNSFIDDPTCKYYINDGDATIVERYLLLNKESLNNWIIIESINSDSTEISGVFNISFLTGNEKILSGERERWDDPNRPDTLHFFDGEFLAVVNN